MSDKRHAAWRKRRSCGVSSSPPGANKASVHLQSSKACCTERDRYCYELALLHEDMHGEAFLTMRQVLGYPPPALPEPGPPRRPPVDAGPCPGDVHVAGGRFELGAHPGRPQFVFDNEKWSHPVDVASFAIARAPVTNAEFMAFVDDGGYACRALWSAPGWRWRCKHAIESPQYWSRDSGTGAWHRRVFDRHVPLAPHQPMVHVGYHEAEAFCAWAGRRLPSEAEWEMAASVNVSSGGKQLYPWGNELPPLPPANLDAALLGCVDVAAHPGGDSAVGCRQMLGNVWEWTSSSFYPYPGYVVDLPYREYSAPWFGYRKVLRGGSFATRARLVSTTYRNFFTPDRRDIFAGFRTCARTV